MSKVIAEKFFREVESSDDFEWSMDFLREKKREVCEFLRRPDFHFYKPNIVIKFIFVEPVMLRYGQKYGAVKEDTEHTVKSVFVRGGDVYYIAGRMKTRGYGADWGFYEHLKLIQVIEIQEDYSKEWANIAKSMRKHNINLNIAENIERHLAGEEEYIKGFQNYWKKTDKPRRMSFKDVLDHAGLTFEEVKNSLNTDDELDYWTGVKYARQWYRQGAGRDRSVYMKWDAKHDCFYYTSASEYAGCGNGDYYCMYSPTMSFYCERD